MKSIEWNKEQNDDVENDDKRHKLKELIASIKVEGRLIKKS